MAFERLSHGLPAFLVRMAQALDQGIVVSLCKKQRNRSLVVRRWMAHHEPAQGARFPNQLWRCDHVAETYPGRQSFGEAADVDDAIILIEAL